MTYWTSAAEVRVKTYQAVHSSRDCPQARRLVKVIPVPPDLVRFFTPCAFCIHGADRWYREFAPTDGSFNGWYQQARQEAS